jgi:hypothetical protein
MRTVLAVLVGCVLSGCTIGDGSGTGTSSSSASSSGSSSSSGGTASSGIPEVDGLFGTLGKATGDKLAGVWSATSTSESGDAEVRFRFAEGKLVAGVKCTYPSRGNATLLAGAATTLTTTDLASGSGQFRIGDTLTFRKTSGELDCQGRFDNLSYTFVIQGTTMQLGATEAGATATLVKVGD